MNKDKRIANLAQKLAAWRKSKRSINTPVPENLRRDIIELAHQYSVGHITAKLDLSGSMVRGWMQSKPAKPSSDREIEFLEVLPSRIESPAGKGQARVIDIFRRDGLHLRISGDFTESSLVSVGTSLVSEMQRL